MHPAVQNGRGAVRVAGRLRDDWGMIGGRVGDRRWGQLAGGWGCASVRETSTLFDGLGALFKSGANTRPVVMAPRQARLRWCHFVTRALQVHH